MNQDAPFSDPTPQTRRANTLVQVVGMVSVTLFIASEVIAADMAAVWALAGLLGLGPTGLVVFAVLLAIPTLYVIAKIAQLAYRAETDPDNN